MIQRIGKTYKVEEVRRIEVPQLLASYGLTLKPSRINLEAIFVEVQSNIDIIVRPSIGIKTSSIKPWIFYVESDVPRLCIDSACYNLENRLKIAPLSENTFIASSGKKGYLIEVLGEGLSVRNIDVGGIIGYAPFTDRIVLLISSRGLRRKVMAVDQGYTYSIDSYCIERVEGHSLVAYESEGYTRIYFGVDYGGYSFYDIKGSPSICSIGHRVASIGINGKGSIYIGRGLYLETPLNSKAIAWIPEKRELLLYDEKSGWLIESDLKSFKPIARLPEKPIYIGSTKDSHIVSVSGNILAIKDSILVRPDLHGRMIRAVSASHKGIVIDTGNNTLIASIDGRVLKELKKREDITCWGFTDKLLCISGYFIGIIDPDKEEEIIVGELEQEPGIYVKGSKAILDISLEGPIDILDSIRDGDRYIAKIASKTLTGEVEVKMVLKNLLEDHVLNAKLHIPLPEIEVVEAEMITTPSGIFMKCNSPGYVKAIINMRGKEGFHELYKYVARVKTGEKVIGKKSFIYIGNAEPIKLEICIDAGVEEAELEIVGFREVEGEAFYRSTVRGRSIDMIPKLEIIHREGFSRIYLKINTIGDLKVDRATLRLSCLNTVFEKSVEGEDEIVMNIAGCEAPASISIIAEAGGFIWRFSRNITLKELEICLNKYMSQGTLDRVRCSEGGFYKYVDGISYEDRSPIRSMDIFYGRGCTLILDTTKDASYIVTSIVGGLYRYGSLKSGINRIDLDRCCVDMPLRLCIYDGASYREYLINPPPVEKLVKHAYVTSYKLYNILERIVNEYQEDLGD
ncbi:MAG: hypothetical protein QXE01_02050 [Sulfolobales archaeon]